MPFRVVRAHDASDLRVSDARLEGGSVVFTQILLADDGVEPVTLDTAPVLQVVPGEVLAVCDDFVVWIRREPALQPSDELINVLGDMEWVFSGRLLSSAPSRVFERVDIWSEEVQSCSAGVVERARLGADNGCNGVHEFIVKTRTDDNRLREGSRKAERLARSGEAGARTKRDAVLNDDEQGSDERSSELHGGTMGVRTKASLHQL